MLSRNQKTSDDVARLRNGLNIRRPRKKSNMLNDKRIKSCTKVHRWLLQSPAVSASGAAFCRRAYGHTTAAERQQEQQRRRRRGRRQSGARASSDDFSGVRISSGASCSNLGRLLRSLPRGDMCWLRTGAARTRAVLRIVRNRKSLFLADKTLLNSNIILKYTHRSRRRLLQSDKCDK